MPNGQAKITEEELTFVLRKFVSNFNWGEHDGISISPREAFRKAIHHSRGVISQEAEICITHAFLDSF